MRLELDGYETETQLKAILKAVTYLADNYEERKLPEIFEDVADIPNVMDETPEHLVPDRVIKLPDPIATVTTGADHKIENIVVPTPAATAVSPDGIVPLNTPVGDLVVLEGAPDSAGIFWDKRAHASSKSLMANGQYTKKRGLAPAEYEAIIAEQTTIVAPVDTGRVPAEAVVAPDPANVGFGTPDPNATLDWPTVVQKVFDARTQERVTQEQMDAKAVELGVQGFMNLGPRPDLWERYLMELSIA